MTEHDSQRNFAVDVVRRLSDAGHTALWAGGCVRDFLLGRIPKDYDVATSATPQQVRELFGQRRTLAVGESFGVIVVLGPKTAGQIEVATFRTDGQYLDGRRPDSVQFSSPEVDAQRRDFTINGMFYDPLAERVLDFVGGEHDLATGRLRAIGDPRARMTEDKLRMLRAVRFASTFEFELDPATAAAVREMAEQIHVVSGERIAQELRRMLVDPHRHRAIALCHEVGLLFQIVPELAATVSDAGQWQRLQALLRLLQQPDFPLALASLLLPVAEQPAANEQQTAELVIAIGKRLKLSNREIDDTVWLLRCRDSLNRARSLKLSKLKRVLAEPLVDSLLALLRAKRIASDEPLDDVVFCESCLSRMTPEEINPPPLISGNELIKSGLKPGPRFKDILDAVRDAQLELQIATQEEAAALAHELSRSETAVVENRTQSGAKPTN